MQLKEQLLVSLPICEMGPAMPLLHVIVKSKEQTNGEHPASSANPSEVLKLWKFSRPRLKSSGSAFRTH